jgi:hypothetical protein
MVETLTPGQGLTRNQWLKFRNGCYDLIMQMMGTFPVQPNWYSLAAHSWLAIAGACQSPIGKLRLTIVKTIVKQEQHRAVIGAITGWRWRGAYTG